MAQVFRSIASRDPSVTSEAMAELFSGWLLKQILGMTRSRMRALVAQERNRKALDDCARRALRAAVVCQRGDLGDEELDALESALAELLWSGDDSLPLDEEPSSLWDRLSTGATRRFAVLNEVEADDEGTTQAEVMRLDSQVLAGNFLDRFYRDLEEATVHGEGAVRHLWEVLSEGRGEARQTAISNELAEANRRLAAMEPAAARGAEGAHTRELADELLRGPLRARGLDVAVEEATSLADHDPAGAAERLSHVTEALATAGFSALADGIRRRTAELLVAAGKHEEAATLLADMVWQSVQAGGQFIDRGSLGQLRELTAYHELPRSTSFIQAIELIDQWYGGVDDDVDQLVPPLRELLGARHPIAGPLVLWVAETAAAFGQLDVLGQLSELLNEVLELRSAYQPDDEVAVRARLCLVDFTGATEDLARQARRGELDPRLATLVFARLARHYAWQGQFDEADDAYCETIKQACAADLPRDAGQAMRSLARVQWVYAASLSEEWMQTPGLAARVEASGSGSLLQRRRDPLDAGLIALANEKLPDAVRHLRTSLRDHGSMGHLEAELDAHKALVKVFREFNPSLAVKHAIAAGGTEDLKALLPLDQYLEIGECRLKASAPWQRAAAFLAVALQGDLIPDTEAGAVVDLALASTQFTGQGPFGAQVWLNAWAAIAAVAGRLSRLQAKLALAALEPDIGRDPGRYRPHDDEHVRIVAAIYETQPTLRTQAQDHLLALLEQGGDLAMTVATHAAAEFSRDVDAVAPHLHRLADAGNAAALELLLAVDLSHRRLVAEAAAATERELSRSPEPPGHFSFGVALTRTAYLARVLDDGRQVKLARHLLSLAEDRHQPEVNRGQAISALRNLAQIVPPGVREDLFAGCMAIAEDPGPPNELDRLLRGGLHPLSTFRINLGFGSLVPDALCTAALLGHRADDWDRVVATAAPLLVGPSEAGVAGAARALWHVPHEHVNLDLNMLAGFSRQVVRQLAAVLWVHRPDEAPALGTALARGYGLPGEGGTRKQTGCACRGRSRCRSRCSEDPPG